ncbi:hypothetical protein P154DRAFT_525969 [Amniculicola lignicola CBS 123094]|uniref:Mitochondrial ATPase complex subunit ATP10 n=1 Tax=Amniculicola lignicola CBS 123094 TaxID=1392246 RepID=A0A6A5WDZ3_9PLEO|nr:hypothetical protein P154DRAFT_525969 [Amniculicola lignicola CBS 123094]
MLQPRLGPQTLQCLYKSATTYSRLPNAPLLRPIHPQLHPRLFSTTLPHHFSTTPLLHADETYIPKPLGRPIGFQNPPLPGENAPEKSKRRRYTGRTMGERNLEKRKDLVQEWGDNYFRDHINVRKYRSGKTFAANPRIFKESAALYFPNLVGETLEPGGGMRDTTNVLKGKVSLIKIYGSEWGRRQTETFTGVSVNRPLRELLEGYNGLAQEVDITTEENSAKAWLTALFRWQLRRTVKEDDWGKYFVITKGVSDRIREALGLLTKRNGYVYLVDQNCKIRWAGSANAEGEETAWLTRGLEKMIDEAQRPKVGQAPKVAEKTEEPQPVAA